MGFSAAIPEFSAGLIAGGKSSRMGRDKAGVVINGVPLWQRQIATLDALGPTELLISGRPDGDYVTSGIPVIYDNIPNAGPLAGIASLLDRIRTPYLLVLAVDMPFMTPDFLRALLQHAQPPAGIVPRCGGFYEGLAALFPKSTQPLADIALRNDQFALQHFVRDCLAQNVVTCFDTEDAALLRSVNHPGDLSP